MSKSSKLHFFGGDLIVKKKGKTFSQLVSGHQSRCSRSPSTTYVLRPSCEPFFSHSLPALAHSELLFSQECSLAQALALQQRAAVLRHSRECVIWQRYATAASHRHLYTSHTQAMTKGWREIVECDTVDQTSLYFYLLLFFIFATLKKLSWSPGAARPDESRLWHLLDEADGV